MPYRKQGGVPLVRGGRSCGWLLLSSYPTIIITGQPVLLMVTVVVWWWWWGCGCCLGGHRRSSRGRWRGCGGDSRGCGLSMFARFPCPLAMLDQAEELHGAFPFSV